MKVDFIIIICKVYILIYKKILKMEFLNIRINLKIKNFITYKQKDIQNALYHLDYQK